MHIFYINYMHEENLTMRTTVDLDDDLIKEALKITGITKKTKLLEEALREIIRMKKRLNIIKHFGRLKINPRVLNLRHRR